VPIYYNHKNTGRPVIPAPDLVFWSHYGDEENSPLYPFGYGLSYTTFEYGSVEVSNTYSDKKEVKISVTLTNTGKIEGKEVAQLYIRDLVASVTRPVKELKGFEMVSLAPGESKTVEFILTDKELGFYDNDGNFLVENGDFDIFVGGSSETTNKSSFELK